MASITVTSAGEGRFHVRVTEAGSHSDHDVTVGSGRERPGVSSEELVTAAFRFLLDREPKESILPTFDLSVIGRFFPEYDEAIEDYLA